MQAGFPVSGAEFDPRLKLVFLLIFQPVYIHVHLYVNHQFVYIQYVQHNIQGSCARKNELLQVGLKLYMQNIMFCGQSTNGAIKYIPKCIHII